MFKGVRSTRSNGVYSLSRRYLLPKEKNLYPFALVNVRNKPKGRLSLMYKAPWAFKRFGIPIGLGPADRPQKPTRHHIHTGTGWGRPDIQILLFGRLPILFYIFLFSVSSLTRSLSLFHTRIFFPVTLGSS